MLNNQALISKMTDNIKRLAEAVNGTADNLADGSYGKAEWCINDAEGKEIFRVTASRQYATHDQHWDLRVTSTVLKDQERDDILTDVLRHIQESEKPS